MDSNAPVASSRSRAASKSALPANCPTFIPATAKIRSSGYNLLPSTLSLPIGQACVEAGAAAGGATGLAATGFLGFWADWPKAVNTAQMVRTHTRDVMGLIVGRTRRQ